MATTLQDLRDKVYWILREVDQDTTAYPYSLVDLYINLKYFDVLSWLVIDPRTSRAVNRWRVSFLNKEVFYNNIASTTLTEDAAVWDTVITVGNTDNFSATWALYIAGNIVTYTWLTSTTFTWCSWILYWFKAWIEVATAYAVPTDFGNATNMVYNNTIQLEYKLYDDIYEDLNKYKGRNWYRDNINAVYPKTRYVKPFWTIKDNAYIIVFNINSVNTILRMRYEKKPTALSSASDAVIIDQDIYAQSIIPLLAVGQIMRDRWQQQSWTQKIIEAIEPLKSMYAYYNNNSYQRLSWVQYKMWKWNLNV